MVHPKSFADDIGLDLKNRIDMKQKTLVPWTTLKIVCVPRHPTRFDAKNCPNPSKGTLLTNNRETMSSLPLKRMGRGGVGVRVKSSAVGTWPIYYCIIGPTVDRVH